MSAHKQLVDGATVHNWFPTLVYQARLAAARSQKLNRRLRQECLALAEEDLVGRRWSQRNYRGGYTSYNSQCRMQQISPTFKALEQLIDRHVRSFVGMLDLDLRGRKLAMTDCWVNIMRQRTVHSLHLHPLSTISGTYYVATPLQAAALKFEDPRLPLFMAAPPRKHNARDSNRQWHSLPAGAGKLVLFESWLRHEVPPNESRTPRISISFNYNWF